MKKKGLILSLSTLLILGAIAFAFVAMHSTAAPKAHADNAAVVINDISCTLLDGNGNFASADDSHVVINHDGSMIKCSADVTPSATGHAAHFDFSSTGLQCSTTAAITAVWHEEVSASGQATLSCLAKNP